MKKFKFRLQKVLEYREMVEQWAKDSYLDARAARLEAEADLLAIPTKRSAVLAQPATTLEDRKAQQRMLDLIDEEEAQQRSIVDLLDQEEEKKRIEWTEKKQELEVLLKLREKTFEEWLLESNRAEQRELDEWSVQRKAA